MQLARNPDVEPSIDELLRDYMGAVPPIAPVAGPNDVVVGATDTLERSTNDGALQPADVPPSNINQTGGGGQ
jgi:general secretion pathway protein D